MSIDLKDAEAIFREIQQIHRVYKSLKRLDVEIK